MSAVGFVSAAIQLGLEFLIIKPKRGFYNVTTINSAGKIKEWGGQLVAQAVIEEHHHDELMVTEHPIAHGAPITDHAYKRPAELTLKLGWSNSPTQSAVASLGMSALAAGASVSKGISSLANAASIVSGGLGLYNTIQQSNTNGVQQDQVNSRYRLLLAIQEQRALFTLYTGKRKYDNMIIKSLSTTTDEKTANSLPITVVCQQVILVDAQTVQIAASTASNAPANASPINKGAQSLLPSGKQLVQGVLK